MNPDQNWKTERKTDLYKINRKKITKDFPVKKNIEILFKINPDQN